jgi:hypothetical protein
MEQDKGEKKSINWGGLAKGLIAGAAIVVGFALVCPGTTGSIIEGVKNFGQNVDGKGFMSALSDMFKPGESNWMSSSIGWLVTKVAGAAALIMGANYLLSDKKESHESGRAREHHEARESFALREDMRKMQAVMVARMQASGHEPAMAQQSR